MGSERFNSELHRMTMGHPAQHRVSPERRGIRNFIGVVTAAGLFTVLLACGAGKFGQRIVDVDKSRRAARGEQVLQEMLDAISAYPFETIAMLRDPSAANRALRVDPEFDVTVGVTSVKNGLLRIEAELVDKPTRQRVGQFVTYRRQT